jgi:NAD(P)-dependent dehydrogenase (short-subunit alcohol dehydrogenase family)
LVKNTLKNILKKLRIKSKVVPIFIESTPEQLLNGKTVLISGGTSGIGFEISKVFLMTGADVIICGRNSEKINNAIKAMNSLGNVSGLKFDISNIGEMEDALNIFLTNTEANIDILVNSAGINSNEKFGCITEEMYDGVLDTNLKGTLFLSQIIANHMKENNIKGNILNIASTGSFRPADTAYRVSKWGLRGLTLGMAKSLIKYDIVVNGIAPGPTATSMLLASNDNISSNRNPSGRMSTVEEVAELAKYLVSDRGRMVVGEIVSLSGGAGVLTFDDVNY